MAPAYGDILGSLPSSTRYSQAKPRSLPALAAAGAGAMQQRCEVFFSGRVQGVGFRYTTRSIAANHLVTGYVRNLPDGRVHLEAEGERAELDAFLAAVADRMGGAIRDRRVDFRPATGEFSSFDIRH